MYHTLSILDNRAAYHNYSQKTKERLEAFFCFLLKLIELIELID